MFLLFFFSAKQFEVDEESKKTKKDTNGSNQTSSSLGHEQKPNPRDRSRRWLRQQTLNGGDGYCEADSQEQGSHRESKRVLHNSAAQLLHQTGCEDARRL